TSCSQFSASARSRSSADLLGRGTARRLCQGTTGDEWVRRAGCDTRGFVVGPPYRPVDALTYPRFSGIRTFMRLPHVTDLTGVDAVVYGIPFDTATSFRAGQRYGPEGIRSASVLLRPYHPAFAVDICVKLSIVVYGDVPVAPGDTEGTYRRIEEALAPIVDAGIFPLGLGGDHSVTLA